MLEVPESASSEFLDGGFKDSELVIGLVGAVGTNNSILLNMLKDYLLNFNYVTHIVKISQEVIPHIVEIEGYDPQDRYVRINALMDAGNEARRLTQNNAILAYGVAKKIYELEGKKRPLKNPQDSPPHRRRHAYIIDSLKHPDEVKALREIYSNGFFLMGAFSEEVNRRAHLERKAINNDQVEKLILRDEDENIPHGQQTAGTFHLSDFFINLDNEESVLGNDIGRIIDLIFGDPYRTPSFDEFAMFMAFSASLRSADLSRQVGAVITRNDSILATGANDCPKAGGGLYWPEKTFIDTPEGRDHTKKFDSNKKEQEKIIEGILKEIEKLDEENETSKVSEEVYVLIRQALDKSGIKDITEYGRVVHAEMEAILSCARNNISTQDATLYGTTFPCHNCAKHIIDAGIERVVYVEPYPKSQAYKLHPDAIKMGLREEENSGKKVKFEPFVGVGPRRFVDLFSMKLGSGYPLKRKDKKGNTVQWQKKQADLRIQMLPLSYWELEALAANIFKKWEKQKQGETV